MPQENNGVNVEQTNEMRNDKNDEQMYNTKEYQTTTRRIIPRRR